MHSSFHELRRLVHVSLQDGSRAAAEDVVAAQEDVAYHHHHTAHPGPCHLPQCLLGRGGKLLQEQMMLQYRLAM